MAMMQDEDRKYLTLYKALMSTKVAQPTMSEYGASPHGRFGVDCDEVYPNLFISDGHTARNKKVLMQLGITHVVNTAQGAMQPVMVNTSSEYYADTRIKYKGIPLVDLSVSDAEQYFPEVTDFIDNGLRSGGKVLVHCLMGISRSATMVIAFLMIKRGMTAVDAITQVRRKRGIRPNEGFLLQLASLDNKLSRRRHNQIGL